MPHHGKRSVAIADLTGDGEENSRSKQPRLNHSASSQPHASQSLSGRDAWGTQDDSNEIIDLSQDVDEGNGWQDVGSIDAKIVGVRFYSGYATMNEQVMVKREPGNPYDSNAIRVNNFEGTQIGHIPKALASKLAPYMDSRAIVVEGLIAGEKGPWDCPILLKLYGPAEPATLAALEARMKTDRLPLKSRKQMAPKKPTQQFPSPPSSQGYKSSQCFGSSSQQVATPDLSIQDFIASSERFRPRDVQAIVESWGQGQDVLSQMPMADQPERLESTLLPYQRQGLAWMLEKENPVLPTPGSKDVVQLWKRDEQRKNLFYNIASLHRTATEPTLAKGGILADDMGLGKTLQVISLILEGSPGTTLIMAPVSVMSNWAQQIERHVKKECPLKVLTYHGSDRKQMSHGEFGEYDVVVTSYGTLSSECFGGKKTIDPVPRKSGLFSMNWARVVLDEGHQIRNPGTKAAQAASTLLTKSKWVLSGTPIVNSIKDLYSMVKFLGITGGLERLELFNAILTRPLALGNPNAEKLLQLVMRSFCLRRKKDMKFVDLKLPELSEYVHRITFLKGEKEKYEALLSEAKGMAEKIRDGTAAKGLSSYSHILEILLRLRQTCCHWKLTGSRITDLLAVIEKDDVVVLNEENRVALQCMLQISIDSQEECSICLDTLHNPVITACKHVFGGDCIERTIELQHKCPLCRTPLPDNNCLVHPAIEEIVEVEIDTDAKSSKTEALMSILKASRKDPKSKVVIFSQWTSFLNIIQSQLEEAGMKFARIDGSMKPAVREKGLVALESDPDTRILLASLAVCSVGLNLVSADTVILADSWWAPAIEDQAVDRVHRLGQKRPCKVFRLVMEGSIEERVLDIQAEKRKLVSQAFQEKTRRGTGKQTRMGDIMKLLA